jgi:3D (Asp-Asp-Asp) domain-containing protein
MYNIFPASKTKLITFFVLVAFGWEFMFPLHAAAADIKNQNNLISSPESQISEVTTMVANDEMSRLPEIPEKPQPVAKKTMTIAVTAYSSTVDQCGADPFTTASGTRVHDGTLAANFLPIGTRVRLPDHFGNKIFVVEDRMAARFSNRADIWMPSRAEAKQWGIRHVRIEIL